jgi:hypothetical protein
VALQEQQIRFAARFRNNLTSYIRLIERMRYDASLLASLRLFRLALTGVMTRLARTSWLTKSFR